MPAPYKIWEFTANSGNHARLKVWLRDQVGASAAWGNTPSKADAEECDQWFGKKLVEETGRPVRLQSWEGDDLRVNEKAAAAFALPDYEQRRK